VTTTTISPPSGSRRGRAANQQRTISPAMNAVVQISNGPPSAQRRTKRNLSESQVNLKRAVRNLRGIRQRHEIARAQYSESLLLTVHVAFDDTDMSWIGAVINALEKAIVDAAETD
jgi:hypothetical protein